jgi:hypothetical protein
MLEYDRTLGRRADASGTLPAPSWQPPPPSRHADGAVRRPARPMATDAEVQAKRVAAVFRQTRLAGVVTAVNAILMAAVLLAVGHAAAPGPVAAWLLAILLVAAARLAVWRAYRRRDHAAASEHAARRWGSPAPLPRPPPAWPGAAARLGYGPTPRPTSCSGSS